MTSLEHIVDTVMSWQHWPKTEVKVWWTIGVNEPLRWLPNPNSHGYGVKEVSRSRATCHHKENFLTFPNFSLVIFRPVPLYFLTSLRRITFAWSIIQPFEQIKNKVSLFNNLTSLRMNETRFLPWSTSPSLFYVLTSLTTVKAWSFFIFREFKKEEKRKLHK